jgi:hypothetical protein
MDCSRSKRVAAFGSTANSLVGGVRYVALGMGLVKEAGPHVLVRMLSGIATTGKFPIVSRSDGVQDQCKGNIAKERMGVKCR